MLEVQKYLKHYNDPAKLTEEFGIKIYHHPTLPIFGAKYNQIDSPKYHPIVRECRGIVLEDSTYKLVAKGFTRFFNYGECEEEREKFDWSNFTVTEKVDGSLILVYYYEGSWRFNTSGSFGDGKAGTYNGSWERLFLVGFGTSLDLKITQEELPWNKNYTYIFELCSPWTQVVQIYPEPKVTLLGISDIVNNYELSFEEVKEEANRLGISKILVSQYHMKSTEDIYSFLHTKESEDPAYEGVVIRDRQNIRFKIKSESYIRLHHMADNGNIGNPKHFVPFLLKGEAEEVLIYFPSLKPLLDKAQEKIDIEYKNLVDIWNECGKIEVQKDFALAIMKRTRFSGILFTLRKTKGREATVDDLMTLWQESHKQITEILF
jgi:hypothetical protein